MERGRGAKVLGPKVENAAGASEDGSHRARKKSLPGSSESSISTSSAQSTERLSRGQSFPPRADKKSASSRGEASKRDKKPKERGGKRPAEGGVFATLEKLKNVPAEEQKLLLKKKIQECKVVFDFTGGKDQGEIEGKRQTLFELVEYVTATPSCFDEALLSQALDMIGSNLFRALTKREPASVDVLDPEDDCPCFDPAWPHLELVYEFLLRVVKHVDTKISRTALNQRFLLRLLELFDSDDPRERECLKTTINKVYTRFGALRTCIRRGIHNVCLKAIHESGASSGVAELLEILSRIIGGFAVPLKQEHRDLLYRALVPLHKLETLSLFHTQLLDCLKKYIEKDVNFACDIVMALLRFWPVTIASKQILFLNELEDMLSQMPAPQLPRVQDTLSRRLAACVSSPNSDVAERALNLCKNSRVTKLITQNCRTQYPVVITALYENATSHWANPVHKLTFEVLKLLMETDPELFDHSSSKHRREAGEAEVRQAERERRWALLRELHERRRARSAARAQGRGRPGGGPGGGPGHHEAGGGSPPRPSPRGRAPESPGQAPRAAQGDCRASRLSTQVLAPRSEVPLPGSRYGVIASWDSNGAAVDLGFQALAVDRRGKIVGAVHDTNSLALQAALWHTKTDPGPSRDWFDSTIWVKLSHLPQAVALLMLVAAAYSGGHLCDVSNGVVRVVEEAQDTDVAHFVMDASVGDVGPVACIRRNAEGGWSLVRTEEFVKQRRHFMDILEPTLGRLIRELVPGVPKRHKAKLALTAMEQGSVATLPQPASAKWIFASIGWDLAPSAGAAIEVNISAVFIGADVRELGAVSAEKAEQYGARHCGGGILGGGLVFDLDAVPQDVLQIALLVNLQQQGATFDLLQRPHCSIVDPTGTELIRYTHAETASESGMIMARMFREAGRGRWGFQVLGTACSGNSWKQSLDDLKQLVSKAPQELQIVPDDIQSSSDTKRSIVSL